MLPWAVAIAGLAVAPSTLRLFSPVAVNPISSLHCSSAVSNPRCSPAVACESPPEREPGDDEPFWEDAAEEGPLSVPAADWNPTLAWQRFALESVVFDEEVEGSEEHQQQAITQLHLAGVAAGTFFFLLILHAYLLHAGGGLVIVPEGDFFNVYNFRELSNLDNAHLLNLGLPAVKAPPTPPLFRWSFLTAIGE